MNEYKKAEKPNYIIIMLNEMGLWMILYVKMSLVIVLVSHGPVYLILTYKNAVVIMQTVCM